MIGNIRKNASSAIYVQHVVYHNDVILYLSHDVIFLFWGWTGDQNSLGRGIQCKFNENCRKKLERKRTFVAFSVESLFISPLDPGNENWLCHSSKYLFPESLGKIKCHLTQNSTNILYIFFNKAIDLSVLIQWFMLCTCAVYLARFKVINMFIYYMSVNRGNNL